MMMNFLAAADAYRKATLGESALYAFLGFAVVFLGISFLIIVVWMVGKILSLAEGRKQKFTETEKVSDKLHQTPDENELSEETIAVIMAALAAYYEKENKKCEFTVKRIKRL